MLPPASFRRILPLVFFAGIAALAIAERTAQNEQIQIAPPMRQIQSPPSDASPLELSPESASFYSTLGAAYFARKEFEHASEAYTKAVQLDPEIFEHTSHTGIAAQMASPQDRAHYDYVLAKLYAKIGDSDHSLQYLRKAMEDGYKGVTEVYSDPEFAELRKDARFADLMKAKPPAIPE